MSQPWRRARRSAAIATLLLGLTAPAPAQHAGVYDWGSAVDSLQAAADHLGQFAFDTLRIFVGGKYDYVHPEGSPARFGDLAGPATLVKIASLPRYRLLFEGQRIGTLWLTAYPVFDYGRGPVEIDLTREPGEAEWNSEAAQMRDLTEWLYRNYGDRDAVVLISNNETDEKLRECPSPARVARDLALRMQAVESVRQRFPAARLKVFFGVEVKFWRLTLPDGTRALNTVLPRLRYDFVSFSAWELASHPEQVRLALRDLNRKTAANLTAAGRAYFGDRHVLIGEFGYAREWNLRPERLLSAVFEALRRDETPYAIYWQLYDNRQGEPRLFGLVGESGALTPQGTAVGSLWRDKRPVSVR